MQLQFAIEGELQLSRNLQGIAQNAREWAPAFEEVSDKLLDTFSGAVFETEGQAIDERWDPLTRAYALRKAKKFGDVGILRATGTMQGAFVSQFDSTSLTLWNTVEYFKYHQSKEPRIKIPRRVMLKLTGDMRADIVRTFQRYFQETLNL